ncbi:MAG: RNB domain-containing ribonuclease, partial [Deltaproteobacteria bacterium]|nr:RNB domain-containing ribonuclease [Deltaproteobacteria bacterium]
MTAKTVVEFLEGGDFCLAFVLELPASSRGAWEVLTQTGQTLRLSPGRVLVSQTLVDPVSKPERLAALAEIDRLRRELARTIQIEELWAVLEGEGPEFDYELLAGLAFGREPSADELSAVRRAVAADGLFFSFTPQTARRNTAEEAARKKLIRERQLARQAFLKESGTWIRDTLDGRLAPEPEGAEKAVLFLTNLAVQEEEAPDPRTAKEILKAAGLPENPRGAFAALAGLGRFSKHENLELLRLGLGQEFSPAELAAAEDIINKFQPDSGRLDLTGREVVTIDAAGAREFDDAISLQSLPEGRFELGLHIADVAAAVEPGSILDETARMRAASIYLPEAKYSMLPEKLTEKILSLKLGETRPAFSLLVELDPYGEPKKYSFKPTLIQVKKQMSFDEADRCLESDPFLSQCSRLGRILLNRRLEFGGQNLSLPQLQIRLGPGGEIRPEVITWDTPARLLVGEMMILANHLAAEALSEAGLACPYRCQEKPRGRHL